MCFFFFQQKTAYEMRISDWSSDVCSSDLSRARESQALDRAPLSIALYLRLRRRGLPKFTAWRFLALCDQTVQALASASLQAAPSTTSDMRACSFRWRLRHRHYRTHEFLHSSPSHRAEGQLAPRAPRSTFRVCP